MNEPIIELPQEKTDMIELSIKMNEVMNYNISIPRVITPQTFPEIVKRLKAVLAIIPSEDLSQRLIGSPNPVLGLCLEESEDLYAKYKKLSPEEFNIYLLNTYNLEYDTRASVVALMGRVKKNIKNFEENK